MSWSRFLGSVGAAFVLTVSGTALARPPGCDEQCQPETPNNILCTCWERAGAPVTTCGQYRVDQCGLLLDEEEEGEFTEASSNTSESLTSEEPQANVCVASL
jgi:hypothetical protein